MDKSNINKINNANQKAISETVLKKKKVVNPMCVGSACVLPQKNASSKPTAAPQSEINFFSRLAD